MFKGERASRGNTNLNENVATEWCIMLQGSQDKWENKFNTDLVLLKARLIYLVTNSKVFPWIVVAKPLKYYRNTCFLIELVMPYT